MESGVGLYRGRPSVDEIVFVVEPQFTLVSYGSGGGNIGGRLSELERRMDELTKRIDDAASAGGAGR